MADTGKKEKSVGPMVKRLILMVVGVAIIGMGSGMFRIIDWGLDPFSCFVDGMHRVTGIGFGNIQLIYNLVLFIPILFMYRKTIGIGTLVNMVGVGYMSDFTVWVVQKQMQLDPNMVMKGVLFVAFLILFGFGIALYMEALTGTAPYDSLGDLIEEKTHGKIKYNVARVIMDVFNVVVGTILGLTTGHLIFGVATIIMAAGTGFIAGFFRNILSGKNKKATE